MKNHLRVPIHVVLYLQDDVWFAHCLEFDLIGDGPTQRAAMEMLGKSVAIQIEESIRFNNPANLFAPADGENFRMFAAGQICDVAADALRISSDMLTIEKVEVREYVHVENPSEQSALV